MDLLFVFLKANLTQTYRTMFGNVVVILRVMKKGRFSKSKRDLQHKSFVDSVLDSFVKYNTP